MNGEFPTLSFRIAAKVFGQYYLALDDYFTPHFCVTHKKSINLGSISYIAFEF
jgi:hypothetical protein